MTARALDSLANDLAGVTDRARLALELRAGKEARASAAATSRESVMRILDLVNAPNAGICWDVAHDVENAISLGRQFVWPEPEFLDHVIHLHLHDIAPDGEAHCPPFYGIVPVAEAVKRKPEVTAILEIRWRMAERLGNPWQVLVDSYGRVSGGLSRAL